jgi:hypothetical protein
MAHQGHRTDLDRRVVQTISCPPQLQQIPYYYSKLFIHLLHLSPIVFLTTFFYNTLAIVVGLKAN